MQTKASKPSHTNRTGRAVLEALEAKTMLANWYVATNGNDYNGGTKAKPFATIERASWSAKPGDVVLVRGGTYAPAKQQWLGTNGTPTQRITYKPYAGEKVIFDGKNTVGANHDLISIGGDHITIQGFTIRNSKESGVMIVQADGIRIIGNHVTGNAGLGICGWGATTGSYSDVLIEGNTVDHNGRATFDVPHALWSAAIHTKGANNVTIRNNDVYNNWGEGVYLTQNGPGALVEGNKLHDNFSSMVYLMDQSGVTVRNNFMYSQGDKRFFNYNAPARAVQVGNETWGVPNSRGNTIVGNVSVGCSFGFYYGNYVVGGGLLDTTVANNTWVNSTQGTVWIDPDQHSNTVFKNNITYQSVGKTYVFYPVASAGIRFESNLWYGKGTLTASARSKTDVFAEPKFVKAGTFKASDYQLQAKSPAINKGAKVSQRIDFAGKKRTRGAGVDLGAFEMM